MLAAPIHKPDDPTIVDGKYRLEERLGEGGLGVVYRAVHLGLEKSFAVKLLKAGTASPAALARFRREAVALGRLRHPHIVEVTDSGVDESSNVPYLVMEVLAGVPLSDLCQERAPLPLAQALPILEQVADAIDSAHGAGVLHRDLKPGNVVVCAAGPDQLRAKVLDFGLAELLAGSEEVGDAATGPMGGDGSLALTVTGGLPGTPLYAAPELIRHGQAGPASDIYSFGVIAYELLGGVPPFQGTVAQVLGAHLEAEPPPLPLAPEIWEALRQALHKDPARRPRRAGDVVRALREGSARAELARWRAREIPRRRWIAVGVAALLLALGLILPWPLYPGAERWIGDLRVRTSPARSPDPRILLVTLDEASLASSPLSLADRADEIARDLSRIFAAGARGVALDLLPPAKWSASQGFSDLLLRHSERLTLAVFSDPDGNLVGTECVDGLTAAALGPRRSAEIFGFVNLDEDPDGVTRRGRLWFRDTAGNQQPSWAARAARGLATEPQSQGRTSRSFWIDTRVDWQRYVRLSWRHVPAMLDRNPELFRDRLVLLGGEFRGSGDDYNRISHRSGRPRAVSGLTLQALTVDTIGAGLPIREAAKLPVLAMVSLAAALGVAGVLCRRRAGPIVAGAAGAVLGCLAVSFPVFWWTGWMLPATTPSLLLLGGFAVALALRKLLPSPPEVSTP